MDTWLWSPGFRDSERWIKASIGITALGLIRCTPSFANLQMEDDLVRDHGLPVYRVSFTNNGFVHLGFE